MKTSANTIAIYVIASGLLAAITNPGYGAFSGIALLLGGTALSLKLSIVTAKDIYYDTLDAGVQFSSTALSISLFAFGLWILGGYFLVMSARSKWRGGFVAALVLVWIIGSGHNLVMFGLQSL
ncbi:hypothetical protein [Luteolibacter sp. AS25]|uniref:hypothetical protein n=1 Tax=Luteolibacter sp. AS25 TaxID=3135776 RepID=UPI00398ACAC4